VVQPPRRPLIDVRPVVQLEQLWDELFPPAPAPSSGPIEMVEVSPGVFAMPKRTRNPSKPSRLSELLGEVNDMHERLEQQLGAAVRKAYRR
jgi:hypothetical protein